MCVGGGHTQGWDKTYCLQYLNEFETIHFFGDKTFKVRQGVHEWDLL